MGDPLACELSSARHGPVVVVTAHGPGIEEDIMELGDDAYLDKPFLPSALRSIADDLLDRT